MKNITHIHIAWQYTSTCNLPTLLINTLMLPYHYIDIYKFITATCVAGILDQTRSITNCKTQLPSLWQKKNVCQLMRYVLKDVCYCIASCILFIKLMFMSFGASLHDMDMKYVYGYEYENLHHYMMQQAFILCTIY